MALERTNTVQLHDLVVYLHFDSADGTSPDRHIPCPWNGFVERVYLTVGGAIATSAYQINLRHVRNAAQLSNRVIEIAVGQGDSDVTLYEYDPVNPEVQFQTGDTLEFDSVAAGAGSTNEPVGATVVLRRL